MSELSRERAFELLAELGHELDRRQVKGRLFVISGAAMALAFNTARTVAAVDAVFEPTTVVFQTAWRMAGRHHHLDPDWVVDAVRRLAESRPAGPQVLMDVPGLSVSVPLPRHLLALKVQAAAVDQNEGDIRLLARVVGVDRVEQILEIAERVVGRGQIQPAARSLIEQMFG